MSITGARRRCGFLVAVAVAALPLLAQPLPAAATSTGTLFAITGINQNELSRIDPGTGVVTDIEDLAGADQGQVVSLTGDPATHRLFAIRTTMTPLIFKNELLTIDSQFNVVVSSSTSVPAWQIQFDPSSGNLYGLAHDATGIVIDSLEPTTGASTTVASLGQTSDILGMAVAPGLNTIYVNDFSLGMGSPASSRILTVNLQTSPATVTPGPSLNRPVRNIAYDSSSHVLTGTTEPDFLGSPVRDLVQIDPGLGTETTAANINDGSGIFNFSMTTDPTTHTVYLDIQYPIDQFTVEDHVYSINDAGGGAAFQTATEQYVWSLYFEPGNAPADTSPPVTSIALSPAPNTAGWNHTNVTVNLSATDPDGLSDVATVHYSATGPLPIAATIVPGSSAAFTVAAEGVTTVTYFAVDQAGNSEATHIQVVQIDKTQPTITYAGNAGTYTVDQTVAITCTALDPNNANGTPGSGLASSTCANANAPAYSFPLGPHTLSASATDIAGNIGNASTTFTVHVTYSSLCTLTGRFIESSAAFQTSPTLGRAQVDRLCKLLAAAGSAPGPAKKALVKAYQKGLTLVVAMGFLTPAQAATLLTLSQAL
jgi:hypothetical protein